ncbi:MAG: DoxX family protein [Burkholderiales bacterium]|nr:DoxX family protein [Burkholderiales bacterium]
MNTNVQHSAALAGRILLALIFIISGYGKLKGYDATAAYMASKGLPLVALLLPLTILIELGGGLLIAIGWNARWVAAATFLFLIPVTLVFHNPAGLDAAQAQGQTIQLLKNISIMGGMLGLFAFGPGRFSIESWKSA